MISQDTLKEFTKKFQTFEINIAREYIQHLFLSSLYRAPGAGKLLFKGGTALRFIYGSPRFSEDLDFSGENIYHYKVIEDLFINALSEIEKEGIKIALKEAKSTSGGYLGIIHYEFYDFKEDMNFEISLRKGRRLKKDTTTIVNEFIPAYTICHLSLENIINEKIRALIERKKPRDYYDLYFILRHPLLRKYLPKNHLEKIKKSLGKEKIDFKKELSILLPISHHQILKNFKNNLLSEIEKQ